MRHCGTDRLKVCLESPLRRVDIFRILGRTRHAIAPCRPRTMKSVVNPLVLAFGDVRSRLFTTLEPIPTQNTSAGRPQCVYFILVSIVWPFISICLGISYLNQLVQTASSCGSVVYDSQGIRGATTLRFCAVALALCAMIAYPIKLWDVGVNIRRANSLGVPLAASNVPNPVTVGCGGARLAVVLGGLFDDLPQFAVFLILSKTSNQTSAVGFVKALFALLILANTFGSQCALVTWEGMALCCAGACGRCRWMREAVQGKHTSWVRCRMCCVVFFFLCLLLGFWIFSAATGDVGAYTGPTYLLVRNATLVATIVCSPGTLNSSVVLISPGGVYKYSTYVPTAFFSFQTLLTTGDCAGYTLSVSLANPTPPYITLASYLHLSSSLQSSSSSAQALCSVASYYPRYADAQYYEGCRLMDAICGAYCSSPPGGPLAFTIVYDLLTTAVESNSPCG